MRLVPNSVEKSPPKCLDNGKNTSVRLFQVKALLFFKERQAKRFKNDKHYVRWRTLPFTNITTQADYI